MTRTETLKAAECIVNGERESQYGDPEDSFTCIARLWSAYLDEHIGAADVAAMMILLKTARIAAGTAKDDNWIDIAGYAACGCEIQSKTV